MLAVCSSPVAGASQQALLVRRLHLPINGIVPLNRLTCRLVLHATRTPPHATARHRTLTHATAL
jgi:hypothetical protein